MTRSRSRVSGLRRVLRATAILVGLGLLAAAGYWTWYTHRTPPEPLAAAALFPGVTYERVVVTTPRPCVYHLAAIDLATPGLEWVVTPPKETGGRALAARRTSVFLEEFRLDLAVNAGYFDPFWSNGILDYYPHAGDPVDVIGLSAAKGAVYGKAEVNQVTLAIARDGKVSIGPPGARGAGRSETSTSAVPRTGEIDELWDAVSGFLLLEDGEPRAPRPSLPKEPHPRTAVGLDREARHLFIAVTDGRQPGYSEGATTEELARFLLARGAFRAVLLDGGGSSSLVANDGTGRARALNFPVHGRHPPGMERPVANHLGLRVGRRKED